MDVLARVQWLVARGRYRFTVKAALELQADNLEPADAVEALLNATAIKKILRSRSASRAGSREKLYVIESCNDQGTLLYTKGKFARVASETVYYLLISSKRSTANE